MRLCHRRRSIEPVVAVAGLGQTNRQANPSQVLLKYEFLTLYILGVEAA
jgi:hypothetical protein